MTTDVWLGINGSGDCWNTGYNRAKRNYEHECMHEGTNNPKTRAKKVGPEEKPPCHLRKARDTGNILRGNEKNNKDELTDHPCSIYHKYDFGIVRDSDCVYLWLSLDEEAIEQVPYTDFGTGLLLIAKNLKLSWTNFRSAVLLLWFCRQIVLSCIGMRLNIFLRLLPERKLFRYKLQAPPSVMAAVILLLKASMAIGVWSLKRLSSWSLPGCIIACQICRPLNHLDRFFLCIFSQQNALEKGSIRCAVAPTTWLLEPKLVNMSDQIIFQGIFGF